MSSTRQQKISRLLQKELGDYFQRNAREILGNKMATVTTVRISPDLSVAKVYLSIFPYVKEEKPLEKIKEHAHSIRLDMGKRIGKQLRIVPEFVYFIDDSLDYIERIENLLNE